MSSEEAELAKLEASLSSQSKMIPANTGMTNEQIKAQQQAIQQTLASNTATVCCNEGYTSGESCGRNECGTMVSGGLQKIIITYL